jgi:hypothetical protein
LFGYVENYDGSAVAIDGDTMVSGAPGNHNEYGGHVGCVYVYVRSGSGWTLQQTIKPAGVQSAGFGSALALDGDTLVVGAPGGISTAPNGKVAVYTRTAGVWTNQAILTPPAAASEFDQFGCSVGLDGDRLVVGAYMSDAEALNGGAVYVFQRASGLWNSGTRLTSTTGEDDWLGMSVAVSGGTVAAGSPSDDGAADGLADSGAVRVFTFELGTGWTEGPVQRASDAAANDMLGCSVGVSGSTVVAGADQASSPGGYSGAAYVFALGTHGWAQQQKLVGADTAAGDRLGKGVALVGNTAIVGARSADVGAFSDVGAAYVFKRTGTVWTQAQKLIAADAVDSDEFGFALGFDGTRLAVGADYQTNVSGLNAGASYVFDPAVAASTAVTIKTTATSARIGGAPILSGRVTPAGLTGKNLVVYVKKPGKRYWSYSSNRTVYSLLGYGAWYYKYTFKKGMTKGLYYYKATVPATDDFITSTSPTISIRLR